MRKFTSRQNGIQSMLLFGVEMAYGKDDNDDAAMTMKKQWKSNENTKKIQEAIRNGGEQEQDVKTVSRARVSHCSAKHLCISEVAEEKRGKLALAQCGRKSERVSEQMKKHCME